MPPAAPFFHFQQIRGTVEKIKYHPKDTITQIQTIGWSTRKLAGHFRKAMLRKKEVRTVYD